MNTFVKHENFITNDELVLAREKFEVYQASEKFKRTENIVEMLTTKENSDVFLNEISKKIQKKCEEFCNEYIELDKLWMVHSTPKVCNQNELPYIPHFDKTRYVKGFLYLYDVDKNCGPLTVCTKQMPEIEKRRRLLPLNYFTLKANVENGDDHKSMMKKICGKSGSLIIFDTNTLHQAGIVQSNNVRKILRFDYQNPNWNKYSSFDLFYKKVYWMFKNSFQT